MLKQQKKLLHIVSCGSFFLAAKHFCIKFKKLSKISETYLDNPTQQ